MRWRGTERADLGNGVADRPEACRAIGGVIDLVGRPAIVLSATNREEPATPKAAVAIVLFGFVLAASGATSATAMQVVPLSKCVASSLNGEIVDAGWRRCWRDRWGRMRCTWCWRDRWGRVRCR
jgi:hypothetical protein